MSGGFWDCYPYHKEPEEMLEYINTIENMVKYCRNHNQQELADELERFVIHLISVKHSIKIRFEKSKKIMKIIDYVASGDSNWESSKKEINNILLGDDEK